jgi:hypothetical protein
MTIGAGTGEKVNFRRLEPEQHLNSTAGGMGIDGWVNCRRLVPEQRLNYIGLVGKLRRTS